MWEQGAKKSSCAPSKSRSKVIKNQLRYVRSWFTVAGNRRSTLKTAQLQYEENKFRTWVIWRVQSNNKFSMQRNAGKMLKLTLTLKNAVGPFGRCIRSILLLNSVINGGIWVTKYVKIYLLPDFREMKSFENLVKRILQIISNHINAMRDFYFNLSHPLHSFSFSERTTKCVNPFLSAFDAMTPTCKLKFKTHSQLRAVVCC